MQFVKTLIMAVVLVSSSDAKAVQAQPVTPNQDITSYARFDQWQNVKISPGGDYIAALTWQDGKRAVSTFETESLKPLNQVKFRGSNTETDYFWVNDQRLVTKRLYEVKRSGGVRNGVNNSVVFVDSTAEYYAINADGSNSRYLYTLKNGRVQAGKILWTDIVDTNATEDDYMLAVGTPHQKIDEMPVAVYKVNVKYGRALKIIDSPVYSPLFLADMDSKLRFVAGFEKDFRVKSYILKEDKWHKLDVLNRRINQSFEPLAMDKEGKGVYALYSKNAGPRGLYHFSFKSGYRTEIYQHKSVDLDKIMFDSDNVAYAVKFDDGKPQTIIVNREVAAGKTLAKIMDLMPDQTIHITSETSDGNLKIVHAYGQNNPGSYSLYNVAQNQLTTLFSKRSWVETQSIAKVVPMQYKGYGDLSLGGYVTLPPGIDSLDDAHKLPFVVKVHGGPHGHRDRMRYDSEAQLYANHGIGVLQVNFRGSGGFGAEFRSKGYKRWSTEIQLDIIDGIKSLVEQGVADPDRLCIVGASFGGFSAVQSSIIEPDLFKCAVALNGAYDLGLLYKIGRLKDTKLARHELSLSVGLFSSKLKSSSPINHLDKLKASTLIIHGNRDRRVPIKHAQKLTDILKKRGHDYQYLVIDGMGHQFSKPQQRQQVFQQSLAFIQQHLGLNSQQLANTGQ